MRIYKEGLSGGFQKKTIGNGDGTGENLAAGKSSFHIRVKNVHRELREWAENILHFFGLCRMHYIFNQEEVNFILPLYLPDSMQVI
jgi:hypothetical protein